MKKLLLPLAATALLTACGGGSSSSSESETIDTYNVSGVGGTTTISSDLTTDVNISSVQNTVNIETNVHELYISGTNNLINFADGVVVESCEITGSDNAAVKNGTVTMSCSDSGTGNTGF